VSWKSAGNLLDWICRHPVLDLGIFKGLIYSALQHRAFFHNFAHISRKTDRIFVKIL